MRILTLIIFCIGMCTLSEAQRVQYPLPIKALPLDIEGKTIDMAYMDAVPVQPNGKTVLLLHGKNFNGYYWKDVMDFLGKAGYRVVVPDQVGWGRSGKPDIHYSFHLLAANTKKLLDTLQISKVHVIGHSMGGMLATRFALMYPSTVEKLILENPIGLEDYRTFIPYQSLEKLYDKERKATYASYKKYQQTYYPQWQPEYEQYVVAQAEGLDSISFPQTAWVNALTYQMIYEQPVVYEFKNLRMPTLLIIGAEDRTVVGKDQLQPKHAVMYGQYPVLARHLHKEIKNSKLVLLNGVGHIPHIQVPEIFSLEVKRFLQ